MAQQPFMAAVTQLQNSHSKDMSVMGQGAPQLLPCLGWAFLGRLLVWSLFLTYHQLRQFFKHNSYVLLFLF
jgi:hypothetical protein